MLSFYPEFEVDAISENEIIFMLDCSNSMKVGRALLTMYVLSIRTCPNMCLPQAMALYIVDNQAMKSYC